MTMKIVIALVGRTCCGKETVAASIKKLGKYINCPFETVVQSTILREIAAEKGIEPTPDNLWQIGNALKQEYQTDNAVAIFTMQRAEEKGYEYIVLDGCRVQSELYWLKAQYPYAYTIGICSEEAVRFNRMQQRKRASDPATLEALWEMERSQGAFIDAAVSIADFKIKNNDGIVLLTIQVIAVLIVCFLKKWVQQIKHILKDMF